MYLIKCSYTICSLSHTEIDIRREVYENGHLELAYPIDNVLWTVTFKPDGKMERETLMEAGNPLTDDGWRSSSFSGRIHFGLDAIVINPDRTDSGTFELRDPQGNVAMVVRMEVLYDGEQQYSKKMYEQTVTDDSN